MWIDLATREVALTHSEIRERRPNWGGPAVITDDMIADLGFAPVTLVTPVFDPITQSATEQVPRRIKGEWIQQWSIMALDETTAAANLEAAREAKRAQVNAWRETQNSTVFSYAGKDIAADAVAFKDLVSTATHIALFGEFPPDFPGGWKTMDNSYIALTSIDDFKAMFKAMTQRGSENFNRSQVLKAQIDKSTSTAELSAVSWIEIPVIKA